MMFHDGKKSDLDYKCEELGYECSAILKMPKNVTD